MFLNILLFSLTIISKGQFLLKVSDADAASFAYVNDMKAICSSAPISNLNLCSNKCLECSVSNSAKCATCNTQYTLSNQDCVIDNSIHNFTAYHYLNSGNITKMKILMAQFIDTISGTSQPPGKILHVCQSDTY